jgi:hypothetical protein
MINENEAMDIKDFASVEVKIGEQVLNVGFNPNARTAAYKIAFEAKRAVILLKISKRMKEERIWQRVADAERDKKKRANWDKKIASIKASIENDTTPLNALYAQDLSLRVFSWDVEYPEGEILPLTAENIEYLITLRMKEKIKDAIDAKEVLINGI